MALNRNTLQEAIHTAFETAKEEEWTTEQVAEALANAIDDFVRGGDVVGITTSVQVDPNNHRGTGTQTGVGRVQ
jgi:DNA-binding transcriptional regulator LsrR (DeoR family)